MRRILYDVLFCVPREYCERTRTVAAGGDGEPCTGEAVVYTQRTEGGEFDGEFCFLLGC
jgi:hypothetical protein